MHTFGTLFQCLCLVNDLYARRVAASRGLGITSLDADTGVALLERPSFLCSYFVPNDDAGRFSPGGLCARVVNVGPEHLL